MQSTLKALILPIVDPICNFILGFFAPDEIPEYNTRSKVEKVDAPQGESILPTWGGRYDWDRKPGHPHDVDFYFVADVQIPAGKKLVYVAGEHLEVFAAGGKIYLNVGLLPRMRDIKLYLV